MAINVNLAQLSTLNNQSILTQSNTNFNIIQTALPDTLSRSGQSPNQMNSALDMNNNQIINLPPPGTVNSPARLIDVTSNPTIVVPATGTSGHVVPFLDGNNTWSGTNTFNNSTTFSGTVSLTLPANSVNTSQIVSNSVTNASLAQMASKTFKGNITGSTANASDIPLSSLPGSNLCYVDGIQFTTLASALLSCSSNTTIVISTNLTISADTLISGANTKIRCENGASITATTTGRITFQSTATNSGIEYCTLIGPGTGATGLQALLMQGTNQYVRFNSISNYGNTGSNGTVELNGAADLSGFELISNKLTNNNDIGFLANGTGIMTKLRFIGNYVGNGIWVVPGVGATPQDIVISGNNLDAGSGGGTSLSPSCVQILGGNAALNNVSITGNSCHLAANVTGAGTEGYGLAQVNNFSMSGNSFDSRGFIFPSTNFGYEINSCQNGSVSGNSAVLSNNANGFIFENIRQISITGNSVINFGSLSSNFAFNVQTTATAPSGFAQGFPIVGNQVIFPAGGTGIGFQVNCNQSGSTCSDFTVVGNTIISDGTAGSVGVKVTQGAGTTVSNLLIGPNSIRSPATGVLISAGVTGICLVPGLNKSATGISNGGAASACV